MTSLAPKLAALMACTLLALGSASCGASDEREAEQAARLIVQALDERDPRLCDELVTQRFLERMTGRRGALARAACRRQLSALGGRFRLAALKRVEVRDDRATLTADVETDGRPAEQRLELVRELGGFRLDRAERTRSPE